MPSLLTERQIVGEVLGRLAEIATLLGDSAIATEATGIRDRVAQEQFVVACIGQFKRGKSTLLNALLGEAVLPAGVTPVTAVPTVVRYGTQRSARIQDTHGTWQTIDVAELADYVSEERNPENVKRVAAAEVIEPSPLLANGLCLVDTPGLGSVFDASTKATLALVPQIDVALAVIGTDPPLAGEELRLIESAFRQTEHVLIILNKADRAEPSERRQACEFAKRVIEQRLGHDVERVFELSARDQLNGSNRWPAWNELVATLTRMAAESGSIVSLASGRRAITRIRGVLCREIARAEHALTAPIEASTERLLRLQRLVSDAQRKLDELPPVLEAREHRLMNDFGKMAQAFRTLITATAHDELRKRLPRRSRAFGPRVRREAFAMAQEVAHDVITDWLPQARRRADELFNESTQRFADAALSTWNAIRDAGPADLRELPDLDDVLAVATAESRFRFNEQITIAQPASPLRYLADATLSVVGLRRYIIADAHRFLDWLLELNVGRVESELVERMRQRRIALERALQYRLLSARDRAEASLERAKMIRDAGAAAVENELTRLASLKQELDDIDHA